MVHKRTPLFLCISTLQLFLILAVSSTSPATSIGSSNEGNKLPLHGITPDKFVQAAPLMVAAVCRDGIVIAAAHTSLDDEPLLYHCFSEGQQQKIDHLFQDLPTNYGGPFRIQPIDAYGTTLVCTGWRADCENLVSRCRGLATIEINRFGKPSSDHMYGRYLAIELSFYMAQCAVSERLRPLSCVGLLVAATNSKCGLWLVDSTGAYPVRAHCVGGGFHTGTTGTVSSLINERLCGINFASMNMEDGAKILLDLLGGKMAKGDSQEESSDPMPTQLLKAGTRIEIAFVDPSKRKLMRRDLRSLLQEEVEK